MPNISPTAPDAETAPIGLESMNSLHVAAAIAGQHQAKLPRRGHDRFRIAAIKRGDAEAVLAMLGRCSAATLYHRFHGFTDGVSHVTQVSGGAAGHDAYGAWNADSCVGLASLAVDGDGSTHIGVLVEDAWQRRGAGSALLVALVGRARERRLATLTADVLTDGHFILPLLARIGPITTCFVSGGYRVRVGLEGATAACPNPQSRNGAPRLSRAWRNGG